MHTPTSNDRSESFRGETRHRTSQLFSKLLRTRFAMATD
jgi:hypothetical protein